jgi:hypothetical protein
VSVEQTRIQKKVGACLKMYSPGEVEEAVKGGKQVAGNSAEIQTRHLTNPSLSTHHRAA